MSPGRQGSKIQLDWATISYRSIMRGVVYVVLLIALGGFFYYLKASLRSTPGELALHEIDKAEQKYHDAQTSTDGDPGRIQAVEKAGSLLAAARDALDRQEFAEARVTAQQSQSYSDRALEGLTGEAFTAKVFKHEGDVKIKRARQFVWANIGTNTTLRVGDQIKTASNGSAQVIYFDGTITTIKPGSLLEIRELFEDPTTKVRKIREKLSRGGISATTAGANVAGSFHEVSTDSVTARAVEKAHFEVGYDAGTKQAKAAVYSGSAEVKAGTQTLTLKPQERMEVSRDLVVTRRKIPATPKLRDPADNRIFPRDGAGKAGATLRWSSVPGASRYRLQVARSALFGKLLLDKWDVGSTSVRIPGLREGLYYWRVSAVDRDGVVSAFSESRRFRVAEVRERHTEDREPPRLQVDDFLPSGHMVIVNGRTEPGAVVLVAGQAIDVFEDGGFTAVLRLRKDGRNDVEIVAQDPAGNETRMQRTVYVESF